MHRHLLGTKSAALAALAGALLLGSAPLHAGTVTGTITYEGNVPTLRPLDMNADPDCAKMHSGPVANEMLVLGEGQTMANIFVKVTNPPSGDHPAPSEPAVIDQKGCMYSPHVLGVMAGQPLMFKNSDGILHNVHGLPDANREFNIGMPPSRTEAEQVLDKPEPLFKVKCDVHPWMNAFVAVMTHPYFDVTGKDGKYEIDGLPAGTYEIEAWHEKLGTTKASVTVPADGSVSQDFSLTVPK